MFIELPNGRLINPATIWDVLPNGESHWRVRYTTGTHEDFGNEYAAVIREAVAAPKRTRKAK